jgi:hypothetical protein
MVGMPGYEEAPPMVCGVGRGERARDFLGAAVIAWSRVVVRRKLFDHCSLSSWSRIPAYKDAHRGGCSQTSRGSPRQDLSPLPVLETAIVHHEYTMSFRNIKFLS